MTSDDDVDADVKAAALEDLRDELRENPVKETRLAGLYEEVSTAPPQLWNRATAFIDCEVVSGEADRREASNTASGARRERSEGLDEASGEAASEPNGDDEAGVRAEAVVTDVSKLARGWWAPEIVEDCDAMVTVDVRSDLPLEHFVALATEELDESIESLRSDEADDGGAPL